MNLREKYPLENKKPLKKTIEKVWSWFLFLSLIIFFIFITKFNKNVLLPTIPIIIVVLILLFLLFISIYFYEIFYMRYYFYDIVEANLIIKKGVFSRNEITIPFNRLQDVYVDQDVLDRIFGLYDVHVSSATHISSQLSHIDGLNKRNSEKIKGFILQRIGKNDR